MPASSFAISTWKWSPRYGNMEIKYDNSGEWKDVKSDGRNDSRKTWLGRKNAEIEIKSECRDDKGDGIVDGPINTFVRNMIADIGPRGRRGGEAFDYVEDDAAAFNVVSVTVEKVTLVRKPGTGKFDLTWKLSSWVKPKPGPVVTKTATVPKPWSPGPAKATPPATPKPGFANTPPVVKP